MDIMFELVSRQKHSVNFATSHVFGEAGGYIGRGEGCEWVLPDRSKHISRQHALVTYEDGSFFLEDLSSNGTFFSLGHEPLGKNRRHKIEHGEGFVIGEFTIMARLMQNPASYAPSASVVDDDLLSFSHPLSLNPLVAMDQEEERIARNRMGEFDDLFGKRKAPVIRPGDHSDPRITFIPPIAAVPEQQEVIPEDWDGVLEALKHTDITHKTRAIEIINNIGLFKGREVQLMNLAGGRPYLQMMDMVFPGLRRVEVEIDYEKVEYK